MDKELRAAFEEKINEERSKAPRVTVDVSVRHAETVEDFDDHQEGVCTIVITSKGATLEDDDKISLESDLLIAGAFSEAAAKKMTLNLINRLDGYFPGIKRGVAAELAVEALKEAAEKAGVPLPEFLLRDDDDDDDDDDE